jgi:nicotinate-nucleotide adenylyltransferase
LRIAIFGGTFDPVHSAHLALAREAVRAFGLARVLFVPASRPPHKSGATVAGYEDRYRMVVLACEGEPSFEASRLEEGQERSYSIDTIERVRAGLGPGDELFFLIGADAFAEITTWRRWQDVARAVRFIVAARPGHDYAVPPGATVERLDTVALAVSSSSIRARLAAGENPPELPPAVLAYIRERGLYAVLSGSGRVGH